MTNPVKINKNIDKFHRINWFSQFLNNKNNEWSGEDDAKGEYQ